MSKEIQQKIVSTAKKYVGIKEKKGNQGWISEKYPNLAKQMEEDMKSHGFKYGQAWCAYFGELVWAEVYDELGLSKEMDRYFSGSARRTLKKFANAEGWETGVVPMVGAIAVWKRVHNGKDTSQGHVGIVIDVKDGHMVTIEGNTNAAGSREGEEVAEKIRKYIWKADKGLVLEGFVYPKGMSPEVIFKNKAEGDKFRAWVNDYHSNYAKKIDLDRKGSHTNSFIMKAWDKLGSKYSG
jgi:surface antigen